MKMRIIEARQDPVERTIRAVVQFEDDYVATVTVPDWSSKGDIRKEAERQRELIGTKNDMITVREDLLDADLA